MDDERRSVTTIFWLLLLFAVSFLMISVGAAWAYLEWAEVLQSGLLWPGLLVFGIGLMGAIASLAGIIAWLLRQPLDQELL
ncbi:MAG: hypothetical protein PVF77_12445 [Anaerolineae bacterium]|jgi:hypothetical protein